MLLLCVVVLVLLDVSRLLRVVCRLLFGGACFSCLLTSSVRVDWLLFVARCLLLCVVCMLSFVVC